MLLQKAIDYLLSGSKLLIQFLRTRIQIPVFVLLIPIVFGAVYYFKFRKETKKMQEITTRTISTNADLRLKISADSIHIIQLQNEKQRIINYHFQYIGNLGKMSDAELQSELNRQFE